MDSFLLKKKSMLSGSNVFWLPSGVGRNDVVGAYRFKGVSSEAFALQDLSPRRYNLTKYTQTYSGTDHTPTWSSANGFTFDAVYQGLSGYLDNSALDQSDIKSAVVCYSGLSQTNRGYLITAGGTSGKAFIFAATTAVSYTSISGDQYSGITVDNYTGPGYVTSAYSSFSWVGTMAYVSTAKTSGVIGANFDTGGGLYLDGSKVTTTSTEAGKTFCDTGNVAKPNQGYTFGNSHTSNSTLANATFAGKVIIAAAFYGVELTDAQHLEVATAMLAL